MHSINIVPELFEAERSLTTLHRCLSTPESCQRQVKQSTGVRWTVRTTPGAWTDTQTDHTSHLMGSTALAHFHHASVLTLQTRMQD